MYYAEVDKNGKCFHITKTKLPESPTIIKTDDRNVLGKIWDGEKWNEPISEPVPEQPLSEQEQIAIDTALNVEYITCLLESNMGL